MMNNLFDNQNEGIVDEQLLNRAIELLRQLKKEGKHQNLSADYFQQKLEINKIQLSNLIEELQSKGILNPVQPQKDSVQNAPTSNSIIGNEQENLDKDLESEHKKSIQQGEMSIERENILLQEKEDKEQKIINDSIEEVEQCVDSEDNASPIEKEVIKEKKSLYLNYLDSIEDIVISKKEKKIGLFLKEKRKEKGLSLEEVAESTKIPMICLTKIETQEFSYFNSQANLINYIGLLDREYKCNLNSFFNNIADSINRSRDNCNIVYKGSIFDDINNPRYNKFNKKNSNLIKFFFNTYVIPLFIGWLLYLIIFSKQIIVVDSGHIDFDSLLEEKELPIIKLVVPE